MRIATQLLALGAGILSAMVASAGLGGCTTEAYCFTDCDTSSSQSSSAASSGSGGEGGCFLNCSTGSGTGTGTGTGGCTPTNGGIELCDGLDNDCNGKIDDLPGLDLSDEKSCGSCSNNCYTLPKSNWDPASVKCVPGPNAGDPPACQGSCAADYYDLNGDGLCEYYCVKIPNAADDSTCNNKDDDCDGLVDEDVDVCNDVNNCGVCTHKCTVAHGTPACEHVGGQPCDTSNTKCKIAKCDPGFWDVDGVYANGCEYSCVPSNGGVEICDGVDNDCNGKVDDGIPSVPCQGGQKGVCADPANAGTTQCVNGQPVCAGNNVVKPGDKPELCNNLDDDCDGVVDNSPIDAVGTCGQSNIFPCSLGANQCQNGSIVCVGNIDPQPELCNGLDDNCNGQIDDSPIDATGSPCNVPVPPPNGATSPCKAGATLCVSGSVQCVGSVAAAQGATDTCGVDANCDGVLSNQPDTQTDVNNCGACGNSCLAGAVHANWACIAGACVFQGCQPGYYDNGGPGDATAGDNKCGYACTFVSAQESCNGLDDNCNGQIDEGVVAPSPTQVCGVSPQASTPECTTGVTVACQNGSWKCTFPAGVCNPTCALASETCETMGPPLDNNCNGLVNENVANYGKPCASDDAAPGTQGVCRTTGTYQCTGPNAVACSAVKANCANLPGGCTEVCDGKDNDCDGTVDETFQAKGSNPAFFVKPAVTQIGAGTWIYTYEASRPNADGTGPGTGNGYYTSAPAGVTLDKTPACSVSGRIPWFNVTGLEVDQTCQAMGGHTCSDVEWQTACRSKTAACTWGYATPPANACTTGFTATKYCNIGLSYDFDPATQGLQNGLLPTGSAQLKQCYADWSTAQNPVNNKVFDITGNLREITKVGNNLYVLLGGAFDSQDETGSSCNFTFYNVDQSFEFFDTGFRCCFSSDPTL